MFLLVALLFDPESRTMKLFSAVKGIVVLGKKGVGCEHERFVGSKTTL